MLLLRQVLSPYTIYAHPHCPSPLYPFTSPLKHSYFITTFSHISPFFSFALPDRYFTPLSSLSHSHITFFLFSLPSQTAFPLWILSLPKLPCSYSSSTLCSSLLCLPSILLPLLPDCTSLLLLAPCLSHFSPFEAYIQALILRSDASPASFSTGWSLEYYFPGSLSPTVPSPRPSSFTSTPAFTYISVPCSIECSLFPPVLSS